MRSAPSAGGLAMGAASQEKPRSTARAASTSSGPVTTTRANPQTQGVVERIAPSGAAPVGPMRVKVPPSWPVVRVPSTATLSLNMSISDSEP